MNGVRIRDNENIEKALKRFSRTIDDTGILSEVRNKQHFEKPSVVKRTRVKAAIRKVQMDQLREKEERLGIRRKSKSVEREEY
jgi:small subunit ribosomal protein S21